MAEAEVTPSQRGGGAADGLSQGEREEALSYLRQIRDNQAAGRGTIERVSAPGIRRLGRSVARVWVFLAEALGACRRRLSDSHKVPGRWWRKLLLLRPFRTLSWWMVVWVLLGAAAALVSFGKPTENEAVDWLAKTALAASFAALVATLWHDVILTPHLTRRIRRRIRKDSTGLLRPTLELNATKVIELDPPFGTVPRETLYEEVLPGALARKRDVQIVVAEPGAGKTTALIDLASLLAKIGLVPVLLEMRGESSSKTLYERAEDRFKRQIRPLVGSNDEIDRAWRWLTRRQRIAILVDDLDQIGFDGEPGFVMRRMIEEVTSENQTVVVTARPSGVPVGIAASAITMEKLPFETAVDLVAKPRSREPGANAPMAPSRQRIELWVREGELDEAPLYLEALAELMSVGVPLDLPDDPLRWENSQRPGRWRSLSEKRRQWNPRWVRYLLLDRFYSGIVQGSVRRALAIDEDDRARSMTALKGAALGMLGATGLEAQAEAFLGGKPVDGPEASLAAELGVRKPRRTALADFLSSDDRRGLDRSRYNSRGRRPGVSQHEAIDTGNRLRILEYDFRGKPQFRHRIMQAFMAGRQLAELGRAELRKGGGSLLERRESSNGPIGNVNSFDAWVEVLMDAHHPEKLTTHMALMFAAIRADEGALQEPGEFWDGLAERIVERLTEGARARSSPAYERALLLAVASGRAGTVIAATDAAIETAVAEDPEPDLANALDPMGFSDPHDRNDPDDRLQKLGTAAEIVALLRRPESDRRRKWVNGQTGEILDLVGETQGAMQWTKFQALPALAWLGTAEAWASIWEQFTSDPDYQVRRKASAQLAENAPGAYCELVERIEGRLLHAAFRAAKGRHLRRPDDGSRDGQEPDPASTAPDREWDAACVDSFEALGWVLPPIVSGLSEELQAEYGYEKDRGWRESSGAGAPDAGEDELLRAREQLENLVALAFEGSHHGFQERLAQGFKADAMRHAKSGSGPGQVASNRRLVADVALPLADSWYARMLLYQALALYAISGKSVDDTLDVIAHMLLRTRERHPFARRAAKLSRGALRRRKSRWRNWLAFIWDDATEDGGRIPAVLNYGAAALIGDVAVLVDLKEGSSEDRQGNFGHMEELPYCLSHSRDRHEILGAGCPSSQCSWGFCPYRATSPDEPDQHVGVSRVFCRGERRRVRWHPLPPSWQRRIRTKRLREFWEQMEYKARR